MNIAKNVKIRIALLLVAALILLSLAVWGIAALRAPVLTLLGFDLHDYSAEEIRAELAADSGTAKKLVSVVDMLLYSPTHEILPFDGADEVSELYTDSILSYLMSLNYSKYVCNLDLLSRAEGSYANYNFRTVIPAADFKTEIYRAFGGESALRVKSGAAFTYHEKIDAFSAVGSPASKTATVMPVSLYVTENTYRFTFYLQSEDGASPEYTAIAREREDGTVYIMSIH